MNKYILYIFAMFFFATTAHSGSIDGPKNGCNERMSFYEALGLFSEVRQVGNVVRVNLFNRKNEIIYSKKIAETTSRLYSCQVFRPMNRNSPAVSSRGLLSFSVYAISEPGVGPEMIANETFFGNINKKGVHLFHEHDRSPWIRQVSQIFPTQNNPNVVTVLEQTSSCRARVYTFNVRSKKYLGFSKFLYRSWCQNLTTLNQPDQNGFYDDSRGPFSLVIQADLNQKEIIQRFQFIANNDYTSIIGIKTPESDQRNWGVYFE